MTKSKDKLSIKEKSLKDLKDLVVKKIKERDVAKIETLTGKNKNLKLYKNLKIEVARILTLISEKSILETLNKIKENKK